MDILLLAAAQSDEKTSIKAECSLKKKYVEDASTFLLQLSFELADDGRSLESRKLAGILLKNSLDAEHKSRKRFLVNQWLAIQDDVKLQIKERLLSTLGSSEEELRHTSAKVISNVASIEFPLKQWPDLVDSLITNMNTPPISAHKNQSTLETLGYVCHDLGKDEVSSTLQVVLQGMDQSENNTVEVCLAATKALLNVLDFCQANFQIQEDRIRIMKLLLETAVSEDADIKQAAFECIVFIASKYYNYLGQYKEELCQLTLDNVDGDEQSLALQAIEFWSSMCGEEIDRQQNDSPETRDFFPSHSYIIKEYFPKLVPLLLNNLQKLEEDRNIYLASGKCLGLVARTVGDGILVPVIPFLQTNIVKEEGQEAASYVCGSVFEGISANNQAAMVTWGLDFFLNVTEDKNIHVKCREAAALTLSRIFEFFDSPNSSVMSPEQLSGIVRVFKKSTNDDVPNVAEKVCGAIYYFANRYEHSSPFSSEDLLDIMKLLVNAVERLDVAESKLRTAACETLSEVVRFQESPQIIVDLLDYITNILSHALSGTIKSTEEREKLVELLAPLCGVLKVIIQKISGMEEVKDNIKAKADEMIPLFVQVLYWFDLKADEKAMLAIGAIANVTGTGAELEKHMPSISLHLKYRLENFEDKQVWSVRLIGDLCRALDKNSQPYCEEFMVNLVAMLRSDEVHISIKPAIFSCFGDIALAIGAYFERYRPVVLRLMNDAVLECDKMNVSTYDELFLSREIYKSIIDAYSGISRCLRTKKQTPLLSISKDEKLESMSEDEEVKSMSEDEELKALFLSFYRMVSGH